jgi:septal ring factor EnvC (AmiA/AmiB activator)
MAKSLVVWLIVLLSCPVALQATENRGRTHGNPIRKVVTMLQNMIKKVEAEGEKEKELFDKFMCYCKTTGGELEKSIADAKTKIPELTSAIEASQSKKTQFDKDLEDHRADKAAAEKAMAEATSVRDKESAEFKKEGSESKAEAAQVSKALAALEGGVSSAFLQTNAASELQRLISSQQDMVEDDKQAVISFLSGGSQQAAPGAIIGILKTMREEMMKGLSEAEAAEADATKTYTSLMSAKKKETKACTRMTEEKLQRVGQLATETETLKNELGDTKERLADDTKMVATMKKSCSTKEAEVEKSKELRQQELVALADTTKLLNDDDALELFKKTLPSGASSFLQIQVTARAVRQRALRMLHTPKRHSAQLDFIALALRGKKVGFEGVIKMVDALVGTLNEEQAEDDKKKVYCSAEIDKADDKKTGLKRTISDTESAIAKADEDVAALAEAIQKLTAGIKDLDKSVAEATKQRKEEHEEYKSVMASDSTAKEILGFAKNRLQKFYNPKLYKPPPKRELSEEDQIVVNNGGTLAPTTPGGIGGTGIGAASFVQMTSVAEHKKAESSGVLAMIDILIGDLDKEMTEAEVTEKDSQEDYEEAMKNAAAKRASDSKALAESEAERADLGSSSEELMAAKKSGKKELLATNKYIMALHSECDWLLQYFDVRKEARAGEVDSLTKARAVLNGADFSFLQVKSSMARAHLRR